MRIDPPSHRSPRTAAEEEHVAVIRRRIARGLYNSAPIVTEVARRILASGDLRAMPESRERQS